MYSEENKISYRDAIIDEIERIILDIEHTSTQEFLSILNDIDIYLDEYPEDFDNDASEFMYERLTSAIEHAELIDSNEISNIMRMFLEYMIQAENN